MWTRLALAAAAASERIAIVAGLGSGFRLPAPIRPGDVLSLSVEITSKRTSSSRPDAGILTAQHEMSNQHKQIVFVNRAVSLVTRRPDRGLDPRPQ